MPYIAETNRVYFEDLLKQLKKTAIANPGEFNYLLAELENQYFVTHSKSYQVINDLVGALECNKMELYRRIAIPYEDSKIEINGDVYKEEVNK